MSDASSMSRAQLATMTVASALAVANLYYSQPLLADIGRSLQLDARAVGFIPMLTQAGYALGMLFFVPLGDRIERKRLIVTMSALVAGALVLVALAPTLALLAAASFLVGVTTIVPQLILPFAAHLAAPQERGRVIGLIMGGLLIGVLGARTVSGFLGAWVGWRAMYWIAAALMVALALALQRLLPASRPHSTLGYGELLRSLWHLTREQPVLREAALLGALAFGAFSAFWTTLVFRLETPPYHLGSRAAGLFGLIGIGGALAAPLVGRLADRRSARLTVGLGLGLAFLSYVAFALLSQWIWGMVLGVILLDVGVQSNQVSNQARIYALIPEARSRLNTVYMVSYFIGGALGTLLGANAWTSAGWRGVCAVGLVLLALALLAFVRGSLRARHAPAPERA